MSVFISADNNAFTVRPVALVFNQVPLGVYKTPGLVAVVILAFNVTAPESFSSVSKLPSSMPAAPASSGLISTNSTPALA